MPKGQMPKGPRGIMLGAKGKVKKGTLKRLLQYVTKKHKKIKQFIYFKNIIANFLIKSF